MIRQGLLMVSMLALLILFCAPLAGTQDSSESVPNAFDDPDGFVSYVEAEIEGAKTTENSFYLAISQLDYLNQGGPPPCPWSMLAVDNDGDLECPFGSDFKNGRSIKTPFATFRHALAEMKQHKEDNGYEGHYTLYVRGGEFVYKQILNISDSGTTYDAPILYDYDESDSTWKPVKADGEGNYYYPGDDGYDTYLHQNYNIPADISIKPYNGENVVLDGTCEFEYPLEVVSEDTGGGLSPDRPDSPERVRVRPGHSDWEPNRTVMERTCGSIDWPETCIDEDEDGICEDYEYNKWGLITVRRAMRVDIRGLTVQNSPYDGIRVYGQSKDIVIDGNTVSNTYAVGIYIMNSNIVVKNNTVKKAAAGSLLGGINFRKVDNFAVINNTVTETYNDDGIGGGDDARNGSIANNHVYDNDVGTSIYVNGTVNGIGSIRYDGNIVHDNVYAQCFQVGSEGNATTAPGDVEEIVLTNNICYNNLHGIWLGGYCQAEANGNCMAVFGVNDPDDESNCCGLGVTMDDVFVLNNTVWNNGAHNDPNSESGAGYGFRISNPGATNVNVINNIFSENLNQQMKVESYVKDDEGNIVADVLVLANNITYCIDTDGDSDGDGNLDCINGEPGEPELQFDPVFLDKENGDFHLWEHSSAINRGIWDTYDVPWPEVDFEGEPRFLDELDIGADEFVWR